MNKSRLFLLFPSLHDTGDIVEFKSRLSAVRVYTWSLSSPHHRHPRPSTHSIPPILPPLKFESEYKITICLF